MHQVNYCSHARVRVLYASELFLYGVTDWFLMPSNFYELFFKRRTKKYKKESRENAETQINYTRIVAI